MSPFRRLWLAQSVSLLGDFVAVFGVHASVTFRMHGSPHEVAGIFVAGMLPPLLLSPFTGALADRWNPCRIMIASDLTRALLVLGLVRASNIYQMWAVSFVLGCASSFFQPAMSITVPLLVAREHLPSAYARLQHSLQITRIASPAVAAALVGGFGERACYYVDSTSFLFSAAMLSRLCYSRPAPPAAARHLGAGIRFLLADTPFARLLLALTAATFAGSCFGTMASLYVRDILLRGPSVLAAISALIGAGTLCGTALSSRIFRCFQNPLTLVRGGMATAGATLLAIAGLRNEPKALAASFVLGVGVGTVAVAAASLLQGRTPPELRGRISGISASLTSFAQLAALLLSGLLAAWISVPALLTFSAAVLFVAALALGEETKLSSPPEEMR